MRIIDKLIQASGRSDTFEIYPLGDLHIGSRGCAEQHLRRHIGRIVKNPRAYAIGGGDWLNAILPGDSKRFDFDSLPDWMFEGEAETIRDRMKDVLTQQRKRLKQILSPIPAERWIGAIEGNHEFAISKYHNRDLHHGLCADMGIENLTDQALIRLRFVRPPRAKATVILYIRHGYGGGRTRGAEANKVGRMIDEWEIADICFTGHTHTFRIEPPKPVLEIPRSKKLPAECTCRYRWGANWGCWVRSHAAGPAGYASRACYPARPLLSCFASIKPFVTKCKNKYAFDQPVIEIRQIIL